MSREISWRNKPVVCKLNNLQYRYSFFFFLYFPSSLWFILVYVSMIWKQACREKLVLIKASMYLFTYCQQLLKYFCLVRELRTSVLLFHIGTVKLRICIIIAFSFYSLLLENQSQKTKNKSEHKTLISKHVNAHMCNHMTKHLYTTHLHIHTHHLKHMKRHVQGYVCRSLFLPCLSLIES